ncbi:hypothetical protein C7M84_018862 [Penaeus vannamei]|uniref:Calphotin-like n=1 Tax=Penaeus vannamei TaxID=6689 RepID=A0A423SGA4_PENVA|nr:hypothetical protein C7M84_018862 [Penaeus vannamei]
MPFLLQVVFAVVAAVQVECAPNQLWPAAQKPSAFAPPKKPIFGAKEAPAKVDSALANQHAYEQFINTWLQQASLTLNRPELLKFLKPLAPAAAAAPTPAPEVVPAIGQSVVSSLVEPEVAGALEEVIPLAAAEEAPAEPSLPADALVETQDAAPPAEERPFFQEEAEVGPVPVELRPVPIEPEVLAATPEPEVVLVAAEAEAVPVAVEAEAVPVAVEAEAVPVAVEAEPEAVPVEAEAVPLAVEAETQGIQVGADTSLVAAQPEQLFPLASEAEVVLEPLVTAEALPSLAEQDTSTVLLATEAPPLFPSPRNPSPRSASRIAPLEEQTPAAQPASVVHQAAPVTNPAFPGAVFFPSVVKPVRLAPLPASSGAVTTQGLTYTLQFFPTQDRSHFFVSTKLGS